jgi:hypothetical protein
MLRYCAMVLGVLCRMLPLRALGAAGVAGTMLSVAVWPAVAATTVYTTEASFAATLQSGYYLEDFHSYDTGAVLDLGTSIIDFSSGGYSYSLKDHYNRHLVGIPWPAESGAISGWVPSSVLKFTFSGNPVTAVGGNFFETDYDGSLYVQSWYSMTIELADGTQGFVPQTGLPLAFLGFTSTSPIASLTLMGSTSQGWCSTVDHFYVGTVAPAVLPGDADRNGTVNGADLNIVLSNYNQTFTGDAWTFGDFDGNDTVNGADLNTVLSHYNEHLGVGAAVPEPSILLLASAGLVSLLAYAWRKRK